MAQEVSVAPLDRPAIVRKREASRFRLAGTRAGCLAASERCWTPLDRSTSRAHGAEGRPRRATACRLWFVRMPRPPEASGLKGLEQEVDTYRTQFNLITEALNVKKVRAGC